jgi:hypothetical protein
MSDMRISTPIYIIGKNISLNARSRASALILDGKNIHQSLCCYIGKQKNIYSNNVAILSF